MPEPSAVADLVATAETWNARVTIIRQIPETFGTGELAAVYAAVAQRAYVPSVKAEFAYVHWRPDYELNVISEAYQQIISATDTFRKVSNGVLSALLIANPQTLRVFRLILGFTGQEFGECCVMFAEQSGSQKLSKNVIKRIEHGYVPDEHTARICASVINQVMDGGVFPQKGVESPVRSKLEKPDTACGWETVRRFASDGVPFDVLLHQRAYGGAFRQLLDATSSSRGDLLEQPLAELFSDHGIHFVRTGSSNQAEIARRFGLTVRPSPDFVVFDPRTDALRAIIECKVASDGGTARDKAARFHSLRQEALRLGGVPLFALLAGAGWRRTTDALGPVIRDTDGRAFTLATLQEMLQTEPFPGLMAR